MTLNPEAREAADLIGRELGLLIKLARMPGSSTLDVFHAVNDLPDEDVRAVLVGAVLVLGQRSVIE